MNAEKHPLKPFLPVQAQLLMLGSFPPKPERWSMDFFYPNWQNDMWRIMGLVFYEDKHYFELNGEKRFDQAKIEQFCRVKGIALYDAACEVQRLQDNASDKFLQVVKATDVESLLEKLPQCRAIVTTGQKATDVLIAQYGCPEPKVCEAVKITIAGREIEFWRMPSSSRAYPLKLEYKAEAYKRMFRSLF